jgi:hypothetical protein
MHVVDLQAGQFAKEAACSQLVVGLPPAVQIARLFVGIVCDARLHAIGMVTLCLIGIHIALSEKRCVVVTGRFHPKLRMEDGSTVSANKCGEQQRSTPDTSVIAYA